MVIFQYKSPHKMVKFQHVFKQKLRYFNKKICFYSLPFTGQIILRKSTIDTDPISIHVIIRDHEISCMFLIFPNSISYDL